MAVEQLSQLPDNYKYGWEDKDAVYRNVKTLPMDYAIEMNRLISLQMVGAIG